MKILKKKAIEERLSAKIYIQVKKEYDRKLEFKIQEMKAEKAKEIATYKSQISEMRKDQKEEIRQIKFEQKAKSKRLDREINRFQLNNVELDETVMNAKNIGAALVQLLEKFSSDLYTQRKHHAGLEDDIRTVKTLISDVSKLRMVK